MLGPKAHPALGPKAHPVEERNWGPKGSPSERNWAQRADPVGDQGRKGSPGEEIPTLNPHPKFKALKMMKTAGCRGLGV